MQSAITALTYKIILTPKAFEQLGLLLWSMLLAWFLTLQHKDISTGAWVIFVLYI
jgi:hypothetical protein